MSFCHIGHSIPNQQTNISFKNKKKVRKPEEEWFKVENTHEAIISEEDFQRVQEMIDTRRRSQKNGELQLFAGLIKCADCGWSLGHGRRKTKNGYVYKDWSAGRITEYSFNMLSEKYQTEQQELDSKIQQPLDGQSAPFVLP